MTYPGELARMTQYKDKSKNHADNVNMGLMDYPVLMASDILLYNAEVVPVGKDQKQHLEIARDLAVRFNNRYSPTFAVPEGIIPKVGANVMSLQDPLHKMSKSDPNENAFISMADDKDTIIRKFKRAVTDSENSIVYDVNRPGISNLMTIYSVFTGKTFAEIEKQFAGVGYGEFKLEVGEAVAQTVCKIDAKKKEFLADKAYLDGIMIDGAEKARYMASKMLSKVYKKIGLYTPERRK
jgi:tryptophanyl-tRNA synthetase